MARPSLHEQGCKLDRFLFRDVVDCGERAFHSYDEHHGKHKELSINDQRPSCVKIGLDGQALYQDGHN